jgi:LytS/YehU family sensor histidine kinase
VDPAISPSVIQIPIMMLQPFVENAVWHGLLTKKGDKIINLSFELHEERYIRCTIDDNGKGRQQAHTNLGKNSLATKFIEQRLELMNKIHSLGCQLNIIDKPEGGGTTVIITLPFSS